VVHIAYSPQFIPLNFPVPMHSSELFLCAPHCAQAASGIVFTSTRNHNKAVQAVHVTAMPPQFPPFSPADLQFPDSDNNNSSSSSSSSSSSIGADIGADRNSQESSSSSGSREACGDASSQGFKLFGGPPPAGGGGGSRSWRLQGAGSRDSDGRPRVHMFTFCLERVDEGALKGIWYTVGVRVGDYSV
jgi:hypothetical protein